MKPVWFGRPAQWMAAIAIGSFTSALANARYGSVSHSKPYRDNRIVKHLQQPSRDFVTDYAMWDKKLNLVYQQVLHGLRTFDWSGQKEVAAIDEPNLNKVISEERAAVIASEKAWLICRDADTNAIQTLILTRRGSTSVTWAAINARRLDLVKQRVSQLKKYDGFLYHSSDTDQNIEKDTPIDRWMNKAMDRASTSGEGEVAMFRVLDLADKKWDRELNRVYRKVLQEGNASGRRVLVAAEKAWLSYRDKEGKTIEAVYGDHGSTEDEDGNWLEIGQEKIYLTKYRTLQLRRLDATLNPRHSRGKRTPGNRSMYKSRSPRRRTL